MKVLLMILIITETNDKYIKNLIIPKGVHAYSDLDEAIIGADYIVFAIPSHVIRDYGKVT